MECCKRPIGVFDSGMGGLSVWQEIVKLLPSESIVYYGDGKNCPYGERSREEVIGFVQDAIDLFIEKKCKAIVLACNAATAMSVEYFRKRYPEMIIVGMEPAVKPAALNSRSGNIGILATKATLEGALFRETSHKFSKNVNIISSVGEGFVELVEGGSLPIGALDNITPKIHKITISTRDIVVMATDGITDAFGSEELFVEYLSGIATNNPQVIAESIMNEALNINGMSAKDDMTVLVARTYLKNQEKF